MKLSLFQGPNIYIYTVYIQYVCMYVDKCMNASWSVVVQLGGDYSEHR